MGLDVLFNSSTTNTMSTNKQANFIYTNQASLQQMSGAPSQRQFSLVRPFVSTKNVICTFSAGRFAAPVQEKLVQVFHNYLKVGNGLYTVLPPSCQLCFTTNNLDSTQHCEVAFFINPVDPATGFVNKKGAIYFTATIDKAEDIIVKLVRHSVTEVPL